MVEKLEKVKKALRRTIIRKGLTHGKSHKVIEVIKNPKEGKLLKVAVVCSCCARKTYHPIDEDGKVQWSKVAILLYL